MPERHKRIRQIAAHLGYRWLAVSLEAFGARLPGKVDVSHRERISVGRGGNVEPYFLEFAAVQVRQTLQ